MKRALTLCAVACLSAVYADVRHYDVVVVGGTASGVGAAIAAGREGLKVALTEESPSLGGMISNGVCHTNLRSLGGSNGIFDEFRLRVLDYYRKTAPDDPIINQSIPPDTFFFPLNRPWGSTGLVYEPRVADLIWKQMVAEAGNIDVFYGYYPVRVFKHPTDNRVTGVTVRSDRQGTEIQIHAKITIDATHEGDLLPMAGAAFRIGREHRTPEEPHAGRIYMTWDGHYFGTGEGDNKLQSFSLFAIAKDYGPGADRTIPKPPDYDPSRYVPVPPLRSTLPNRKLVIGVELTDFSNAYLEGDRKQRKRIFEIFRNRLLGWLYYVQTSCGQKHIGLAEDEFSDNGNVAYMLYVREGRRLEGVYVFNQRDCVKVPGFRRPPLLKDSIAVVDWESDSHQVSRDFEGYVHWAPDSRDPYKMYTPSQIPYWVMVPKKVDGLLVTTAVSATHIGFGVLRIDPSRVNMGQAAGVAAAMAIRSGVQPRHISVPELQERLLAQGQSLFFYADVFPSHPYFQAIQRLSLAGVTDGYDDFTFRPDRLASRADASQFVFHGLGLEVRVDDWVTDFYRMRHWNPRNESGPPFHWASYFLMTLYKMGAMDDATALKARPADPITRGELAHWIRVGLGLRPSAASEPYFSDVPASHPFFASIQALAHDGLLPDTHRGGRFQPDSCITRGEACHMVDFVRRMRNIRTKPRVPNH